VLSTTLTSIPNYTIHSHTKESKAVDGDVFFTFTSSALAIKKLLQN
jgi:hypothetical protein